MTAGSVWNNPDAPRKLELKRIGLGQHDDENKAARTIAARAQNFAIGTHTRGYSWGCISVDVAREKVGAAHGMNAAGTSAPMPLAAKGTRRPGGQNSETARAVRKVVPKALKPAAYCGMS